MVSRMVLVAIVISALCLPGTSFCLIGRRSSASFLQTRHPHARFRIAILSDTANDDAASNDADLVEADEDLTQLTLDKLFDRLGKNEKSETLKTEIGNRIQSEAPSELEQVRSAI
jgi:hypothetical protein